VWLLRVITHGEENTMKPCLLIIRKIIAEKWGICMDTGQEVEPQEEI
jgi:hypothetical protein